MIRSRFRGGGGFCELKCFTSGLLWNLTWVSFNIYKCYKTEYIGMTTMDTLQQTDFFTDHSEITRADYEAVEELLNEVKAVENGKAFQRNVDLWFVAYKLFKKKEATIGIPSAEDRVAADSYLHIVTLLRSIGKVLSVDASKCKNADVCAANDNLQACLKDLALGDSLVEFPITAVQAEKLTSLFGE